MKTRMLIISVVFVLALIAYCCESDSLPVPTEEPIADTLKIEATVRYGRNLVWYAQVDKAGAYFRRMFVDERTALLVSQTGEIPDSALLVMETWEDSTNQSAVYIRSPRSGVWQSNSFSPVAPASWVVSENESCNNCHSIARSTQLTFTKPLLIKALQTGQIQRITCEQPSFTPCDLSVYQNN
jgi:hypothetical protein